MSSKSLLSRLPSWLSRWLGYRTEPATTEQEPEYVIYLWSFIGTFLGLSVIQAVFAQAHYFSERGVPPIIASYAGTAILLYGSVKAEAAQPRPVIGGHFFGALTGICITKLFHLLSTEQEFRRLLWLAGSLTCAALGVIMKVTGTIHPPAAATALVAVSNTDIRDLGWYYLPVVLLTSTLALAVALITNNIQRRYPDFWFKPSVSPTELPPPIVSGSTQTLVWGRQLDIIPKLPFSRTK
ncbi:HPP family protein [Flammula alnicola]|nr:HPP family protein [Flammula alnicola]